MAERIAMSDSNRLELYSDKDDQTFFKQ